MHAVKFALPIKAKELERERLAADVAKFEAGGGAIQRLELGERSEVKDPRARHGLTTHSGGKRR